MNNRIKRTNRESSYQTRMEKFFVRANGTLSDKLDDFARFVSRQSLALFLYKYELFRRILDVQGDILEFGVFRGGGLFSFAQLSAILEPYNYQRRVIGFDTFVGFPSVSRKDSLSGNGVNPRKGDFFTAKNFDEELRQNAALFDENRFLNHVEKLSLVKGDICETLPEFLKKNPHIVISLAYLDMDLYEPTKKTLECILPRMPKGAILAFDELNNPQWPGETEAVIETLGLGKLRLQRLGFEPSRCYCVLE